MLDDDLPPGRYRITLRYKFLRSTASGESQWQPTSGLRGPDGPGFPSWSGAASSRAANQAHRAGGGPRRRRPHPSLIQHAEGTRYEANWVAAQTRLLELGVPRRHPRPVWGFRRRTGFPRTLLRRRASRELLFGDHARPQREHRTYRGPGGREPQPGAFQARPRHHRLPQSIDQRSMAQQRSKSIAQLGLCRVAVAGTQEPPPVSRSACPRV